MATIPQQRSTSPSSLTQPGAAATGTCPSCGSSRLTQLAMTLTDGTPVRFQSCHECEHRSWSHDGGQLAFTDVIARATKVKV
jgi:DNA-directed RNA polymerase subunit M/transcription elongation factor TFIIS